MTQPTLELFRAEILDWRDNERRETSHNIRERLQELDVLIDAKIEEMRFWDSINRSAFHNRTVAPAVEEWLRAVYEEFHRDIEQSALKSEKEIVGESSDHSWSLSEIAVAGAATAASLAPLAAIPYAVGLATVTSTSFFVFTTSAISIPILTAIVGGLVVTGIGTQTLRQKTFDYFAEKYRTQAKHEARTKVVGESGANEEDTLLNRLLNEIDLVAISRMEAHT